MKATDIATLEEWRAAACRVGVTWMGPGHTPKNPVLSSWVEAAIAALPQGSLDSILMRAAEEQSESSSSDERRRYYDRLPRRGSKWLPSPDGVEEVVVWTVRRSRGNHHAWDRDITASVMVRDDGGVMPSLRDGLGQSVTEIIMVCDVGTSPPKAIRALIRATRTHRDAWVGLAAAAHRSDRAGGYGI